MKTILMMKTLYHHQLNPFLFRSFHTLFGYLIFLQFLVNILLDNILLNSQMSSSRSSSAYRPPSPSPRAPSCSPVPSPGRGGGAGGSGGAGSAGSPLRPLGGVSGCRVTGTGLARRPAMRVICSRGSVQPQNVECELRKAEYQASSLCSKFWLGGLHDMF